MSFVGFVWGGADSERGAVVRTRRWLVVFRTGGRGRLKCAPDGRPHGVNCTVQTEDKIKAESVSDDKSAIAALRSTLKDFKRTAEDCKREILKFEGAVEEETRLRSFIDRM
ncbi:hypothetical protein O988_06546 [Pseudogymnoascus sp. VKM F-3808]|nr:hypothetical protein O988_06546 [Pseudogymnoascus sp. VKM F-3808]